MALLAGALFVPQKLVSRSILAFLAYAIVALTIAVVFTRVNIDRSLARRYVYVQCLSQVLLFYLVGVAWLTELAARLERRGLRAAARIVPAHAVLVLVWFGVSNVGRTQAYTDSSPENGARIKRCMRNLAALEAERGGPCGFRLRCEKTRDWPIVIRVPRCED